MPAYNGWNQKETGAAILRAINNNGVEPPKFAWEVWMDEEKTDWTVHAETQYDALQIAACSTGREAREGIEVRRVDVPHVAANHVAANAGITAAEMGRRGSAVVNAQNSEAKQAAARENGKRGGRPRKTN